MMARKVCIPRQSVKVHVLSKMSNPGTFRGLTPRGFIKMGRYLVILEIASCDRQMELVASIHGVRSLHGKSKAPLNVSSPDHHWTNMSSQAPRLQMMVRKRGKKWNWSFMNKIAIQTYRGGTDLMLQVGQQVRG